MPTYEFECRDCGVLIEHVCSFSKKPSQLACDCGGEADHIISWNDNSFVKDRPFEFDQSKNVRSNGRLFGKTDKQHHEHYRGYFDEMKKLQDRRNRSGAKQNCQWIGGMPGEMVDSISEHEGKEAVYKDPVTFLKKTGLYAGD